MKSPVLYKIRRLSLLGVVICGLSTGFFVVASPATASSPPSTTTTTTTTLPGTTTTTSTTTTTLPGTTTTTTTTTTTIPKGPIPTLSWPRTGSAAMVVPQLSVAARSTLQPREPIASLTKMMTAWVALHKLPLGLSGSGPCETVNGSDMALYNYDVATDQSSVKIVAGETLCERTLLRGMLVHSAGDYAQLLVALTGLHEATFVAVMNQDARTLGMKETHYVDVTGILSGDLSTATDQAALASNLMTSEPVVQGIVKLSDVSLPLAGVVVSFTPFVGEGDVVGVKSGFTDAAGGCDVMAVEDHISNAVITTYAVVLGEHGDNPLGTAGEDALALSRSIRTSMARVATPSGVEIQWIGSPADVVVSSAK